MGKGESPPGPLQGQCPRGAGGGRGIQTDGHFHAGGAAGRTPAIRGQSCHQGSALAGHPSQGSVTPPLCLAQTRGEEPWFPDTRWETRGRLQSLQERGHTACELRSLTPATRSRLCPAVGNTGTDFSVIFVCFRRAWWSRSRQRNLSFLGLFTGHTAHASPRERAAEPSLLQKEAVGRAGTLQTRPC